MDVEGAAKDERNQLPVSFEECENEEGDEADDDTVPELGQGIRRDTETAPQQTEDAGPPAH